MGFGKSLLLIGTVLGTGLGAGIATQAGAQSAAPFTTAYTYDAARRLVGTIEPDPDSSGVLHYMATRNTYDAAGRLTKVEKGELATWQPETVQPVPLNWTGFTVLQEVDTAYDASDRPIVVSEKQNAAGAVNTVTQTSYDLAGRADCTTVRMNPAVWLSLPASACTLQTAASNGPDRATHNVYDAAGQVLKVQKAYNVTTANGFPATLQQDYATYTYNGNGKETSVTDADGNLATMAYDGQDREIQWTFPSPTTHGQTNAADFESYGYDQNGNRTSLRKRDGTTITYQYDLLNRLTVKTVPVSATGVTGYTVYQGYDNRNLLLYARFSSTTGLGITNVYDNVGRLTSFTSNMDGTSRTFAATYDADGNRLTLSGTSYWAGFDYDGLDRMNAVHDTSLTTPSIATIAYDQIGRRSSLGQGPGAANSSTAYAYDGASRLQTMTHALAGTVNDQVLGFSYNPASQMVQRARSNSGWEYTEQVLGTKSYAVNGLNQYTSAAGATFAYDANGNLSSDGTSTYKYDAENRLVSVTGGTSVTLSYDPMGRLWQYTGPVSGTLKFLYDGDQLVQELSTAGALQRNYVHGTEEDDPLVWYEYTGGTVRRFLHSDHQGSIVAVADDAGNALAIDKYDEWGVPAAANLGRFQYTGQVWLPDLGLYYYKARIYSSRLGRFLQTDPVGYKDQFNLYGYLGNDPVDGRDPSGELGRGTGFDDSQWKDFNAAQQQAAKDMDKRASGLQAKADKLDAKGKGGGDVLRTESRNLRAGAGALRDTSSSAPTANLIADQDWAKVHPNIPDAQGDTFNNWRTVDFRNGKLGIFGPDGLGAKWTIGHEGIHAGAKIHDQVGPNGFGGYIRGKPLEVDSYYKLKGTMAGANNPDNLMGMVYGDGN